MPNYDFVCRQCEFVFEDVQLAVADRKYPTTQPCPNCGETTIVLVPAAPKIGDSIRLGRTHLPSSWTDKLQNIKEQHRGSTIKVPSPDKREI